MTSTTVVICAYTENRWDDLVSALDSLRQQNHPPDEVIIVIDHNEKLYKRASQTFSDVRLFQNTYERGLSGARNTGIELAEGEIIAFMDEDATAHPDWLDTLLKVFEAPEILGVGGQILPVWLEGRPRWFPEEFDWVVGCTYRGMPDKPAQVRNLIGCNMAYRRIVFDTVGTFREGVGRVDTLPVGCEETELCIRINQTMKNQRLIYTPDAIVNHRVPAQRANWRYYFSRCYSEGLSKALIARFIGAKDALSTERTYTLKTLPAGVLRGLGDLFKGDIYGPLRSIAIVAGFLTTGLGYVRGKLQTVNTTKPATTPQSLNDRSV